MWTARWWFQVVQLLEVIPQGMGLVLVMEYLPLSLYDLLHNVDYVIDRSEIKCYVKMILLGVRYLHDNHIMHRVSARMRVALIRLLSLFIQGSKTGEFADRPRWERKDRRFWFGANLRWKRFAAAVFPSGGDAMVQGARTAVWGEELHACYRFVGSWLYYGGAHQQKSAFSSKNLVDYRNLMGNF